jgi:hypothetical protein
MLALAELPLHLAQANRLALCWSEEYVAPNSDL